MNASQQTSPTLGNWLTLGLLGIIWGASFMSVAVALEGAGPLSVAAIRLLIGASILYVVLRLFGLRLPGLRDGKTWVCILGMGLFSNALPFTLLGLAIQSLPSAFAGVSMAAVPLLVLPLAHLFVPDERMTWFKSVGFAIGFIGVFILIGGPSALSGDGDALPKLACIAAAFCYAIGSIITRLAPAVHPIAFSTGGLLVGTVIMVPLAYAFEGEPGTMTFSSMAALIYLGVLLTAVATILLVRVIQSAGPSFLSLVNYQVPIWSVLFGMALLAEALPASFLLALGLILAGLGVSQAGQRRFGRYPSA